MATPFLGELKIVSFNFAPKGWALANGQLLPINQNQALFSLLGTMYGGDGRVNFALPDLRGRVAMHMGGGFTQGERGGEDAHTVSLTEMPQHTHFLEGNTTTAATANAFTPAANDSLGQSIGVPSSGANFALDIYSTSAPNATMAAGTVTNAGGNQAHENRQPFLVLNWIVALQGIFPSQN
jgi:microcystin-dependent protein